MNAHAIVRDAQNNPDHAAELAGILRRLQRAAETYGAAHLDGSGYEMEQARSSLDAALDAARAGVHSLAQRMTPDRSDPREADPPSWLRAFDQTEHDGPAYPRAEPDPERRAYPPADERTIALRRRAIFERIVERDGLVLAPDLGRAWAQAERLAAD